MQSLLTLLDYAQTAPNMVVYRKGDILQFRESVLYGASLEYALHVLGLMIPYATTQVPSVVAGLLEQQTKWESVQREKENLPETTVFQPDYFPDLCQQYRLLFKDKNVPIFTRSYLEETSSKKREKSYREQLPWRLLLAKCVLQGKIREPE